MVAIDRHLIFEFVDEVERGRCGGNGLRVDPRGNRDFKRSRHRAPADANEIEFAGQNIRLVGKLEEEIEHGELWGGDAVRS